MHKIVVALLGAVLSFSLAGSAKAADVSSLTSASLVSGPSPLAQAPVLRVGTYFGVLSDQSLSASVFTPWRARPQSSYLLDAHVAYTFYRFASVPIDLELEGGIAKRFGNNNGGQQVEFDLIPMVRWKSLPWNDVLYTTVRLGLIGASYVTGISSFERQFDSSGHSARFLNLLVPEITFSPYVDAPFEVFVRVHHRSGIYGLINRVHGASNYISGGIRFSVY